jgi:threonyl-tRNA synthetase
VFPLWLAPVQVIIIPIDHSKHLKYCQKIFKKLNAKHIRAYIDTSNDRLSKKIRDAQIRKIPYQLVVGDNEINKNNVTYREYAKQENHEVTLISFVQLIKKCIKDKA